MMQHIIVECQEDPGESSGAEKVHALRQEE